MPHRDPVRISQPQNSSAGPKQHFLSETANRVSLPRIGLTDMTASNLGIKIVKQQTVLSDPVVLGWFYTDFTLNTLHMRVQN